MTTCEHPLVYKGIHPSFKKRWLCPECEQLVELDLAEYAITLAGFKMNKKEEEHGTKSTGGSKARPTDR